MKDRMINDDDLVELIRAAGPREDLPESELGRIQAVARSEWEKAVRTSRRRRGRVAIVRLSLAATLAITLALALVLRDGRTSPFPTRVASVEFATGTVLDRTVDGGSGLIVTGDALDGGVAIETGHESARLALRLTNGISLRFDESTSATLISASAIRLDRGALYVDTGSAAGRAESIEVRTVNGVARDIGTQFEVRVHEDTKTTVVRVREGRVVIRSNGSHREVSGGTELVIEREGRFSVHAVTGWGEEWAWILSAAPPFDIEGHTLAECLDWVRRETGWTIRFESPEIRMRAEEIVLHGTLAGARPDEAPYALLAGSGLSGVLVDGTLTIREASTQ
jgi:hypothetical protein